MGIPSLQAVEESYRQRDVEDQRDREKIASMDRELNKSPKDCVVMWCDGMGWDGYYEWRDAERRYSKDLCVGNRNGMAIAVQVVGI
jgi:hypothetical protein